MDEVLLSQGGSDREEPTFGQRWDERRPQKFWKDHWGIAPTIDGFAAYCTLFLFTLATNHNRASFLDSRFLGQRSLTHLSFFSIITYLSGAILFTLAILFGIDSNFNMALLGGYLLLTGAFAGQRLTLLTNEFLEYLENSFDFEKKSLAQRAVGAAIRSFTNKWWFIVFLFPIWFIINGPGLIAKTAHRFNKVAAHANQHNYGLQDAHTTNEAIFPDIRKSVNNAMILAIVLPAAFVAIVAASVMRDMIKEGWKELGRNPNNPLRGFFR